MAIPDCQLLEACDELISWYLVPEREATTRTELIGSYAKSEQPAYTSGTRNVPRRIKYSETYLFETRHERLMNAWAALLKPAHDETPLRPFLEALWRRKRVCFLLLLIKAAFPEDAAGLLLRAFKQ